MAMNVCLKARVPHAGTLDADTASGSVFKLTHYQKNQGGTAPPCDFSGWYLFLLFLLLGFSGLLGRTHHGEFFHVHGVVGLVQFGLYLHVVSFMALYGVRIGDAPRLFVLVIFKNGLAFLVFYPAGQAHGLALLGGLGFFLLGLLDLFIAGALVFIFAGGFLGHQ